MPSSQGRKTCFDHVKRQKEQAQPQLYGTAYFSVRNAPTGLIDLLEASALDSVEGVLVGGEPFGLASGVRKDQPVLHRDVRVDLGEASEDLLFRLASDRRP